METHNLQTESALDNDVLLDLDDLPPSHSDRTEAVELDIDLNESAPFAETPAAPPAQAFVEPQISEPAPVDWRLESEPSDLQLSRSGELNAPAPTGAQLDDTLEWVRQSAPDSGTIEPTVASQARKLERVFDEPVVSQMSSATAAPQSASDLTPEQIDTIARRAVEMLSEKVVQQIAWEVVPQLAELLIKRRLEEKETQPK